MGRNERQVHQLNFITKIGTLKITAKFSTILGHSRLPEPKLINEIIQRVFDHNLSQWENTERIEGELGAFCYEVVMTPQLKGLSYSYEIIKK